VACLGPRRPGDMVGPRPLSGVVGRPLNFTVRGRMGSRLAPSRNETPLCCRPALYAR
jgi:hypothetical protein